MVPHLIRPPQMDDHVSFDEHRIFRADEYPGTTNTVVLGGLALPTWQTYYFERCP